MYSGRGLVVQPHPLELFYERGGLEIEESRGSFLVPIRELQALDDQTPFQFSDQVIEVDSFFWYFDVLEKSFLAGGFTCGGEVGYIEQLTVSGEGNGHLYRVFQLAHISGPIEGNQSLYRPMGDPLQGQALLSAVFLYEVGRDERDVFPPLS